MIAPAMALRSFLKRAARAAGPGEREGLAAVEFAIFAPVFLVVLGGIVDVGNLLLTQFQLDSTVAAGAEFAIVNNANVGSTNGATLASQIATIVANSPSTSWADTVTVVVNNGPTATVTNGGAPSLSGNAANADLFYCPTGSPGAWSFGASRVQGTSCGAGGGIAGQFVTVTASKRVTTLLPLNGLAAQLTLTQSAIVETQ